MKRYVKSSADTNISDNLEIIRPAPWLLKSIEQLDNVIMPKLNDPNWDTMQVYLFLHDRVRSIVQDFAIQVQLGKCFLYIHQSFTCLLFLCLEIWIHSVRFCCRWMSWKDCKVSYRDATQNDVYQSLSHRSRTTESRTTIQVVHHSKGSLLRSVWCAISKHCWTGILLHFNSRRAKCTSTVSKTVAL